MDKKCSKCMSVKNVSDYYKNNYSKDGLSYICKSCHLEGTKKYRDENPDKIKQINKSQYVNNREERIKKQKQYSKENKEKISTYRREWKNRNPNYSRISTLKKHRLTREQFYEMFIGQNNCCWTCSRKFKNFSDAHIDHNHETGVVRGLLCSHCNTAIGLVKENPRTLRFIIEYLENNKDGWKAF